MNPERRASCPASARVAAEFLARLVTHIPDPGQVMQRYYGWYAGRTRGGGDRHGVAPMTPGGAVLAASLAFDLLTVKSTVAGRNARRGSPRPVAVAPAILLDWSSRVAF